MKEDNKKIAVVLVNYHDYAKRFLEPCRNSLRRQSYGLENFQVYIIDNDSSEETFNYLRNEYPEAKILKRGDGNYSAANNLGFKKGIEDGAKYLVALNMDTEVGPDFLSNLVLALENNPEVGIAQAKILLYPKNEEDKKSPKINSLGNIIHFLGFGFTSFYGKPDYKISGYPEIKGYASGCAFITRADIFEQVGGLNEEFYMYHDDIELSLKIRLAGYKIVLAPQAVVFHKYEFSRSVKMFYFMERNRYLTLLIFSSFKYRMLIFLPALFIELGMLFNSIFNKTFNSRLKMYFYFLKPGTWKKIKKERVFLKKNSLLNFSDLKSDFVGQIYFQEADSFLLKYIANPVMALSWFFIKKLV